MIYDNVSGTGKKQLSQNGHTFVDVFYYVANCFWKGLILASVASCVFSYSTIYIYIHIKGATYSTAW